MIKVSIDNKQYEAKVGETILQVAQRNGIKIPTLCHDERLKPYSSCFVCVVEVEGMKNMQPSCSTLVADGMVVHTKNDKVKKARKTALDLIMSNHYADCVGPCKLTCPAHVDVQGYISLIEKGQYSEAIGLIKEKNPLPAICGRVCVRPCELKCRRNLLEGTGVGVDYLKRFAADKDLSSDHHYKPDVAPSTNKKLAIIGAGPGGLSAAYWLQIKGHQCDIYEAMPEPGGWLRYGIPEYRLPNDVLDKEIDTITELGVRIFSNQKLGDNLSYAKLKDKYDSIILTIGSQKGTLMRTPGEETGNVFSGIDFLRNMQATGKRANFTGKTVAVVGGGNTAMDCCRTAIRCNAEKVYVVYRRTEHEMPANPIEIHESKVEGVEYLFLTNPVKVNSENGVVKSVTLIKMELGEPDNSGRRRPVEVPGSEFDLEVDYILAAIGQKTDVNFIKDINNHTTTGELNINKWGNLDADPNTLQTGIPNIFAAGDGVSGPATIIEAIAQAQIVSHSVHQYLMGEELSPLEEEFVSKKDNFNIQDENEYKGHFEMQLRKEMPVLEAKERKNFNEVELGYNNDQIAIEETARCLECGCSEFFNCDLQVYATEYKADQNKYKGEYNNIPVDFSHPFIEINNNKCILCSRCVRICSEIVGAKALGLAKRGFETFVVPSMGNSLLNTNCESCGLCISACPTGAITENVAFKPGPVKTDVFTTINPYGSTGEAINIHHKNNFIFRVTGAKGLVNKTGNLDKYAKFGYHFYNSANRIVKPMLKKDGKHIQISFDEAYKIILSKISNTEASQNAFFAGARLTNEEQYLVQKLARAGVKTNNVHSFHYVFSGKGYVHNSMANVPFNEIEKASKIYLFSPKLNIDNATIGFMVNEARNFKNIPVALYSTTKKHLLKHKTDEEVLIDSYYYFAKAVNYYLLKNNLENQLFIKDRCINFSAYKTNLLKEDYNKLTIAAGGKDIVEKFANEFNAQQNAVLIFVEKEVSGNTSFEFRNMTLITGKLGKTASGIIALKEKNNAQGLLDMGAYCCYGPGTINLSEKENIKKLSEVWQTEIPNPDDQCVAEGIEKGKYKNLFIFGEDPIGCALDKESIKDMLVKAKFIMVQDYIMSETAQMADLIMPASTHLESGGSFTNTQKVIQHFGAGMKPLVDKLNEEQLIDLLGMFNINSINSAEEVIPEASKLFKHEDKYEFTYTNADDYTRMFKYACDVMTKVFEENFEEAFK